jgi:tetratricopeptide (TPR) repeat protein
LRYLLAETFWPGRREALVPADPQTADDWWIVGQHALTVRNDPQAAWDAFDAAVRINPNREVGEYYAARARAGAALGGDRADQAARDAAMADLLYTERENPAWARLALAEAAGAIGDELRLAQAETAPPLLVDQNFEGVLFNGRVARFQLPPALRPPGPGAERLAPIYAMAEADLAAGEPERAANVYRYILDVAPEETSAAERLAQLPDSSVP